MRTVADAEEAFAFPVHLALLGIREAVKVSASLACWVELGATNHSAAPISMRLLLQNRFESTGDGLCQRPQAFPVRKVLHIAQMAKVERYVLLRLGDH